MWNNFLIDYEKQIEFSSLLKSKVKLKLLAFENEIHLFLKYFSQLNIYFYAGM